MHKKSPTKAPSHKKSTRHKTKGKTGTTHHKKTTTVHHGAGKTARHTKKRNLSLGGKESDSQVKLGRTEPYSRWEKPRLVIDHYMKHDGFHYTTGPVDRASKVTEWPMYLNDQIGNCTCACVGHEIQAWTAYSGTECSVTDHDVLKMYEAVSGYNPETGDNDNGAVVQDVLEYWRTHGIAGHKIRAYAELSGIDNFHAVRTALDLFGTVYLGVQVPQSAMEQFDNGEPWSVVSGSPIEGGHAVPLQKFNADGNDRLEVVTWGRLQPLTMKWFSTYVEEAWVIITDDWLNANGRTVEGLDLAQLEADFSDLTGEGLTRMAA